MFAEHHADLQEQSVDELVDEQKVLAKARVLALLQDVATMPFARLVDALLPEFVLRETNVKDLCVTLEREGWLLKTWGTGNRKPQDLSPIQLIRHP